MAVRIILPTNLGGTRGTSQFLHEETSLCMLHYCAIWDVSTEGLEAVVQRHNLRQLEGVISPQVGLNTSHPPAQPVWWTHRISKSHD